MNCREAQEEMVLGGAGGPVSEGLARHLDDCAACAGEVEWERSIRESLQSLPAPEVDISAAVLERTRVASTLGLGVVQAGVLWVLLLGLAQIASMDKVAAWIVAEPTGWGQALLEGAGTLLLWFDQLLVSIGSWLRLATWREPTGESTLLLLGALLLVDVIATTAPRRPVEGQHS